MLSARTALIDHLQGAKGATGLKVIRAYTSEIERLAQNPGALGTIMPAALVIYLAGELYGPHDVHILVISRTATLEQQATADEALGIAERLAEWLDTHFTFKDDEREYNIASPAGGGIRVSTRKLTTAYAIVDVAFSIIQHP